MILQSRFKGMMPAILWEPRIWKGERDQRGGTGKQLEFRQIESKRQERHSSFWGSRSARETEKTVIYINPGYVSQRYSSRAYIDKNYRKEQVFRCLNCAFESDAKLNAARNLGMFIKSKISWYRQAANCCLIYPETAPVRTLGGS